LTSQDCGDQKSSHIDAALIWKFYIFLR